MPTYLLDSDILINHLRGTRSIGEYIGDLKPDDKLCCCVISLAEVYSGMLPDEEVLTKELLNSLVHLSVTSEVAQKAAEIKRGLKKRGAAVALDDCLIAATAILEKAVLVTLNKKHYPTVAHKIPV